MIKLDDTELDIKETPLGTIRSKTNDDGLCKQYVYSLINKDNKQESLVIRKLLLIPKDRVVPVHMQGFVVVKLYKDVVLMQQIFAMKPKTFDLINEIFWNRGIHTT